MNTQAFFLVAGLYAQTVLGSYYHGPTAVPQVLKSGYLANTHEVAAAKGAHLAALAKESHHGHGSDYNGAYSYEGDYAQTYGQGHTYKYYGPTAIPHVLKSGYLADTREVASAKGAHLAALAKESHYGHGGDHSGSYGYGDDYSGSYGYGSNYLSQSNEHSFQYHGPTAKPVVLKSGYLADTHEVAAAKGAHLAALAKESHYGHGGDYSAAYGYGGDSSVPRGDGGDYHHSSRGHEYDSRYHGPTAIPHLLKDGHVADTYEVTAAKADHYAALSVARSHGGYGYGHGYSAHN